MEKHSFVDVVSRFTGKKYILEGRGKPIPVHEHSIILIHTANPQAIHYARSGNDLVIHMDDGSTVVCDNYFSVDTNKVAVVDDATHQYSEVAFSDSMASDATTGEVALQTTSSPLENITPLLEISTQDYVTYGVLGLLAAGAVAAGVVAANDHSHHSHSDPAPAPVVTPLNFTVENDNTSAYTQLENNTVTSDNTPRFFGSGTPGATIQIKDSNGNLITTATVGADGNWSVNLPSQSDGTHDYNLYEVVKGKVIESGHFTLIYDTTPPDSVAAIDHYTDDAGQRMGDFKSGVYTDDTTPVLTGTLTKALMDGDRVQIWRDNVLLGNATVDGLTWTFSDATFAGKPDGKYTYQVNLIDSLGNQSVLVSDFIYNLDTSVPDNKATYTATDRFDNTDTDKGSTTDTTPILSGTFAKQIGNTECLEITIAGKTYTSDAAMGGTIVIDYANNTWSLQLTDALPAGATTYSAQVKSLAGNGNQADATSGSVTIEAATSFDHMNSWTANSSGLKTPLGEQTSSNYVFGGSLALGANGLWELATTEQVTSFSSQTESTHSAKFGVSGIYQSGVFFDYNRDGFKDVVTESTDYNQTHIFSGSAAGTYTDVKALDGMGAVGYYYGSPVVFDINGDGYLDFMMGDAGFDSWNMGKNNANGTFTQLGKIGIIATDTSADAAAVGSKMTNFESGIDISAVDLNKDGKVDIALQTDNVDHASGVNAASWYTYSSMTSNGDGTFTWNQNAANVFNKSYGSDDAVSMTWADFNGDGYMDLFLPTNYAGDTGSVYLNDGKGKLDFANGITVGAASKSTISLAVDWNADGMMDIVKLSKDGATNTLYTNGQHASSFTESTLGSGYTSRPASALVMDYDWDGAQDLYLSYRDGNSQLIHNTNQIKSGTSIHLQVSDKNGINAFYGNVVDLFDSKNNLVSSQILNPQSGIGSNDSSGLISFYGLDPNETYHAKMAYQDNGTSTFIDNSVNASWGNLIAGSATDCYSLTVEANAAANDGKFVGTGYNDTFFATAGTDTFDGSGGTDYWSDNGTWSATGGMDVINFELATTGVTVDLSNTSTQTTGFNTVTLKNIEGITGSDFADTLTDSKGNNLIEGRGGDDTIKLLNGGHDTLVYGLYNNADAAGGNGHDTVTNFKVGSWEGTPDADCIDLHRLLKDSGIKGNDHAHYAEGKAVINTGDNIGDYLKVVTNNGNSDIVVDRDGKGDAYHDTTIITLQGVNTDLATLLANHQLVVA